MSRLNHDTFNKDGQLFNGFDYEHQAWVEGGVYIRCGHPDQMNCNCYGRTHEGEPFKGGSDE